MTISKLIELLLEERYQLEKSILEGIFTDLPSYREMVGRYRQMNSIINLLEDSNNKEEKRRNEF